MLAVVGIQRGLRRQLTVFRGGGDVALTGTLILCANWSLVTYLKDSELSALLSTFFAVVPAVGHQDRQPRLAESVALNSRQALPSRDVLRVRPACSQFRL